MPMTWSTRMTIRFGALLTAVLAAGMPTTAAGAATTITPHDVLRRHHEQRGRGDRSLPQVREDQVPALGRFR